MVRSAIAYLRVSTAGQANEGVSLEAQRAKVEAWATLGGHNIILVACDSGISGKSMTNRPGLQQALDTACKTKGILVAYSLSRLARSTVDAIQIGTRLEKAGADLVSLSESLETTTAAGRMIFKLLAVLGEFERDLLSERTRSALRFKRSKGHRISGRIPFGFTLADDGQTLNPCPPEQETLAIIMKFHQQGLSLRQIGRELTDMKAVNKSGHVRWNASRIQAIIRRSDSCAAFLQGKSA